jgi:lipid A 3-O-deacylase
MSRYVGGVVAALVATAMCSPGSASAEDGFLEQVRLGVLEHDTGLVGTSKEDGVDVGVEVLSEPLDALRLIGAPRLVVGGLVNSEGQTNQAYVGLMGQKAFAEGVFRDGDAFFIEGLVAGAWHDGKLDVTGTPEEANWKSHGSHWAFRTGFGFGYRFNETWSVAFNFAHLSNADLAEPNEGSNDVGLRIGVNL